MPTWQCKNATNNIQDNLVSSEPSYPTPSSSENSSSPDVQENDLKTNFMKMKEEINKYPKEIQEKTIKNGENK